MAGDGGGWTLILKTAAGSNALQYTSPLWTDNSTTLNPAALDTNGGVDAKFAPYNHLPFREIRGCANTRGLGVVHCVSYAFHAPKTSPYAVFSGPPIYVLATPDPAADAPSAIAMRDAFYTVFAPVGMKDCLPKDLGFNIASQDNNPHRWGFSNNIPSQACQELVTSDADASLGWGLGGQDCGATGAGYNNYFVNDTACGGKESSVDSWVWVR